MRETAQDPGSEISATTVARRLPSARVTMSSLRLTLLLSLVAALAVGLGQPARAGIALARPPLVWLKGEGNFTKSHRSPQSVEKVVVHVTEGQFWGSVTWLRNPRAHASSHYVVSRAGRIVQLVHISDIAWHAGNGLVNRQSVGIEHEGFTADPSGFTDAQYRNSARLVAWLASRSLMPIDRAHVIGHAEVPAPGGGVGGSSHHTDPGPRWNWPRYLALIRSFAHPLPPLKVASLLPGRVARGIVPWSARAGKGVTRVEFVVDGRILWKDSTAPFSFLRGRGLNTVTLDNGRHAFEVRAFGAQGRRAVARTPIGVRNRRFALTTAGVRPWTRRFDVIRVHARVWAAKADTVALRVDGRRLFLDRRAPYVFRWDARKATPGRHVLLLTARSVDGRVTKRRIPLVTGRPVKRAVLAIAGQSVADGQVVSGFAVWRVEVKGKAAQVEFLVDGAVRGTDVAAPYTFGWNADAETAGPHVLTARATNAAGRKAQASVTATAAAPDTAAAP